MNRIEGQLVNERLGSFTTDAVIMHDLVDLSFLILWPVNHFTGLSFLLVQVVVPLRDSCEVCAQSHGYGTTEQFSQSTNDNKLRRAKSIASQQG
jgi:hypothetical protein